ncbi:MAG: nucleotidyltransferase domain-containing protein [Firmicutes bacterium]|nr:nucleotidyltransferase domain-containing protein [Bacillota bacterium]
MGNHEFPVRPLREYFTRRDDVIAAYLFGSFAKDRARPKSDVDVAVLFEARSDDALARFAARTDISSDLEGLLGRRVDVIDLGDAPLSLIHQVLKSGEPVFERNHTQRIEFEVNARRQYLDMLPHYEKYVRVMRRDVERGGFVGRRRGDPEPPEVPG